MRVCLPMITLALVASAATASQPLAPDHASVQAAASRLAAQRPELGLDQDAAFLFRRAHTDEQSRTHARFQQTYKGLEVFGAEIITHTAKGGEALTPTESLRTGILLNVAPSIDRAEALATAHRDLAPKGAYAQEPQAKLVIFPVTVQVKAGAGQDATAYEEQLLRYALAYHVHAELMNGKDETIHRDYMIDAHTGAILKQWNSLRTGAAVGTGNSQFYGSVSLNTNNTGASAYEMRDLTRGNTTVVSGVGNATTNLNHKTSGTGSIYTDTDNTWGDGNAYGSGTTTSTTGATGQTAAVDAHRGLQATWDFYKNIFGRNGIDDTGKSTYSRMHYSSSYDNAFWDDTCFCMTYGDGDPVGGGSVGEADLDTAGHEMSHGVCANTANLTYSGESGGLNESNSDIFGTCVEFYTLGGGTGSTIPDSASILVGGTTVSANYKMFENSWGHAAPNDALRWMYRPNLDGASPNYWYSGMGSLDVHYSSGPNNRFFYFLAAGATTSGDTSTAINTAGNGVSAPNFLPNGMNGIGNDSAARIWYKTLTTYLTSSSTYAQARTAALSAATDLFGANSFEYLSVQNAYHGINVGAAATLTAVKASFSTPASNITVNSGDTISFVASAKDTIPSVAITTYNWNFGDGTTGSSAGTGYPYAFTNTSGSDVTYTVSLTATDANGAASPAVTRQVTVHTAGDTTAPVPGTPSVTGVKGTITFNATATDDVNVTKVEFYVDGLLKGSDTSAPYSLAFDSTTVATGSHTLVVKAYDAANNVGTSTGVSFNVDNTPPTASVTESGTTGTLVFTATASDSFGVSTVGFYLDGKWIVSDSIAPYVATYNGYTLTNGTHTLYVKALDAAGNIGTSSTISFTVSNPAETVKPVTSCSVAGTTGTITFNATATDNYAVAKVGFYVDGIWVVTDSAAPYSTTFNSTTLSNGTHTLQTKAVDISGNIGVSTIVSFTVSN